MVLRKKNMAKTNRLYYNEYMKEYKEIYHTLMYKSNSDMSLYSVGYEECSPGYSYGPKIRSYHMIHFVFEGKGDVHINEHVFHLNAGDAFLIPAGKVSYYEADKDNPWHYAWINFLGINSHMYLSQIMTSTDGIYVIRSLETAKYKTLIMDILDIQETSTSQYFRVTGILYQIMAMLFQDIGFQENSWGRFSVIDEVKFYLDINYAEKIRLQDIARKYGVHPNYLTRAFHEKYGVSPKQYLMDLKLKKACRLLTTTELNISVIAGSLGFDDQFSFAKCFKKSYAVSPSDYRKQSRGISTAANAVGEFEQTD